MADSVHANLDDLRRIQKAVDSAMVEVDQALKKVAREVDRADWKDANRRDFEEKLKAATSAVKQTTERMAELKPILSREIQALQTYLQRR